MGSEKVDTFRYVREFNELLRGGGLFLVSEGKGDKPNIMTIGWGFLGTMWARPICVVAVRHSRHTFSLMEEAKRWTVCVPAKGMAAALEYCGTKSGRDVDKFKEMKLTAKRTSLGVPYIDECPVYVECRTIFKTDMRPGQLEAAIEREMYKTRDFHMIYFGEVQGVYANDAAKRL